MTDEEKENFTNYDLDKWEKSHLPELRKNSFLKSQIMEKMSKIFNENQYNNLNFKFSLTKNMNRLKIINKNENIQNFYKNIEQENSNVLAQNINMMKKRFDFDIFKSQNKLKLNKLKNSYSSKENIFDKKKKKNSLSETNITKNSNNIINQKDELWKVGNELGIRKKIVSSTKTEIKNDIEEEEEIKIDNKILKFNNLKLEGNYNKVISFDVYKGILHEKKKIEKNYRDEIKNLTKEIRNKEIQIENLNKEFLSLSELCEKKKNIFYDNYDVVKVIKGEVDKLDIKQDFRRKTIIAGKMQNLDNIVKKSKIEFLEIKKESERKIPNLKKEISICKLELKALREILFKIKKDYIIYFKNLLKEGVDVRDVGLCWILFRLNELGAKVLDTDFPKFLDYNSINYLKNYSDKIIKLNKLKILLDLVKKDKKNLMKNINLNHFYQFNTDRENNNNNINSINLPYDKIDDFLKEIFDNFKNKIGNKYVIQNNIFNIKDEEYLVKAKEEIRKNNSPLSTTRKNYFLKESKSTGNYKKKKFRLSPEQSDTVNTLLSINNLIIKIEEEVKILRTQHLLYFRRKYESMKLQGTSECIKYDLMFCALFGNFAVY